MDQHMSQLHNFGRTDSSADFVSRSCNCNTHLVGSNLVAINQITWLEPNPNQFSMLLPDLWLLLELALSCNKSPFGRHLSFGLLRRIWRIYPISWLERVPMPSRCGLVNQNLSDWPVCPCQFFEWFQLGLEPQLTRLALLLNSVHICQPFDLLFEPLFLLRQQLFVPTLRPFNRHFRHLGRFPICRHFCV